MQQSSAYLVLRAVCHALSYRVATEKQHHNNLQSRMHLVEDSVYFWQRSKLKAFQDSHYFATLILSDLRNA